MRVRVYTDGACSENPGPGGWAVAFSTESNCFTVSGNEANTTNNRMELRAVIEAYRKILEKTKKQDSIFEIHSDSAYVVNAINNHWIDAWRKNCWKTTKGDDVKNRDLWEQLTELMQKVKLKGICVILVKIKGHAGHTFNELVDKLAREESMKIKHKAGNVS